MTLTLCILKPAVDHLEKTWAAWRLHRKELYKMSLWLFAAKKPHVTRKRDLCQKGPYYWCYKQAQEWDQCLLQKWSVKNSPWFKCFTTIVDNSFMIVIYFLSPRSTLSTLMLFLFVCLFVCLFALFYGISTTSVI